MRLSLALGLVFLFPASALAANGCPDGSYDVTNSPDNSATTILFSGFTADAGGGGASRDTATCHIGVKPQSRDGYSVYSADYRGFVFIEDGQTVTVRDLVNGKTLKTVKGPNGDDLIVSGRLASKPGKNLDINTSLTADAGANPDGALAGIDSLDLLLIGFTTQDSVEDSLDQLATARIGLSTGLATSSDLLLGFLDPMTPSNGVSVLAAGGDAHMVGLTGSADVGGGFSVLGGISTYAQNTEDATADGILLAAGVRYTMAVDQSFDIFGEAGGYGSPNLNMSFSRQYDNSGKTVTGRGDTDGSLVALYGRAGVIFKPDADDEIVASATISGNWLGNDGYVEPEAQDNIFGASVGGQSTSANIIKAGVSWTTNISGAFDLTLAGAGGWAYDVDGDIKADVANVGEVRGKPDTVAFVEYGAKAGWTITPGATLNAFAFGTSDSLSGTSLRFGGGVNASF